jgi:hypothetical protein
VNSNFDRACISSPRTPMPISSSLQLARRFRIYQSLLGPTTTRWLRHYQHSCRPCCPYHRCRSRASKYRLRRQYNRMPSTSSHINNKFNSHSIIAVHRLHQGLIVVHHNPRNQDLLLLLDIMYPLTCNIHLSTRQLLGSRVATRMEHTQADRRIDERCQLIETAE